VTALLGLVGLKDIDPVRSREHILLANIFEHAWSQGQDLDLGELILQTQNPPFAKLGVFDVNSFFPEKERSALAMSLNSILAAPAFQSWIEGQPLDIPSLLYGPDGHPRHSIFYIAHLPDEERMFFVTLLFSAVEAWMRSQSGTTTLRAILYFDEIFGYMPPISNPPSKQPMLRMLKQARAFGVGLVLVTQNPVDLDYKGLSNTGTWFIGKLQTDQDKQRLLDGLEGAIGGSMDRGQIDRLLSGLGKRVFLVNNVHESKPQLFQTRWAMNYLAGPLTRTQLPALNELAGAIKSKIVAATTAAAPQRPAGPPVAQAPEAVAPHPSVKRTPSAFSATRPAVPAGLAEHFLPTDQTLSQAASAAGRALPADAQNLGLIYRPALVAQARIRFLNRSFSLDYDLVRTALVSEPDRRGQIHWENFPADPLDPGKLASQPAPGARFSALDVPLSDAKSMGAIEKDFTDWVYRTSEASVWTNKELKLYAGPETNQAEFRQMCSEAAREGRDTEAKKAAETIDRKIDALNDKLARETRELEQDEAEHSQRKMEEFGTAADTVFNFLKGRKMGRRISSSMTKRRMTTQAKADVEESRKAIAAYKQEIAELEKEKAQVVEEVSQRWGEIANQVDILKVPPAKKDVLLDLFGVAWIPYYLVKAGSEELELPASRK
jgi:hypothetical protein